MKFKEFVMEVKKILVEKGWTQGCFARDAMALPIEWTSGGAKSFCLAGAISFVADHDRENFSMHELLLNRIRYKTGKIVSSYNDAPERTKEDVLALLDGIIAESA